MWWSQGCTVSASMDNLSFDLRGSLRKDACRCGVSVYMNGYNLGKSRCLGAGNRDRCVARVIGLASLQAIRQLGISRSRRETHNALTLPKTTRSPVANVPLVYAPVWGWTVTSSRP